MLSSSFLFFYQGLSVNLGSLRGLVQLKRERERLQIPHIPKDRKNKYFLGTSDLRGAALEGGLEQLQEGSARFVDGRGQLLKIIVYGVHLDVQVLKSNHVSANASLGRVSYAYVPV